MTDIGTLDKGSLEEGIFYEIQDPMRVWKKLGGEKIATLILLPGTVFFSGYEFICQRKMRASSAFIETITNRDRVEVPIGRTRPDLTWGLGYPLIYRVGSMVFPYEEYSDYKVTCDSGIHFFATREEAVAW